MGCRAFLQSVLQCASHSLIYTHTHTRTYTYSMSEAAMQGAGLHMWDKLSRCMTKVGCETWTIFLVGHLTKSLRATSLYNQRSKWSHWDAIYYKISLFLLLQWHNSLLDTLSSQLGVRHFCSNLVIRKTVTFLSFASHFT